MAEEKITPEEKLLKIIENPAVEKPRIAPAGAKGAALPAPALTAFLRGALGNKEVLKYATLQTANKALAVICGCLTIYALYNYLAFNGELRKKYKKITADVSAYKPVEQKNVLPDANLEDLVIGYRSRNIFSFMPTGPADKPAAQKEAAQATSTLKLVGVIWSASPQAMVEDTQENKTHLVSAGDMVGQLKINKITRNSVFIGKGQEEWELR